MLKAVLAVGCVSLLAACGSGGETAPTASIAKVADVKSSFGPEFHVTDIAPKAIDPKLLTDQKLPPGLKFEPANCAKLALGPQLPPGLQGNMAAVSAEGNGNRFVVMAVETSKPVPVEDPGRDCKRVVFGGGRLRGAIEVVDAPQIEGTRTLGVHRVVRTIVGKTPRTGELYNYSAHFGSYQVIVVANSLVLPGKPVVPVDTTRARDLLVKAVSAVRS